MDQCSGKIPVGGLIIPRKESGPILQDAAQNKDKDVQFCNRFGCNGRLNHNKSARNTYSEKLKASRACLRSSSGKETIGNSTRTSYMVTNSRKSRLEYKEKLSSKLETDSSGTSSNHDGPGRSGLVHAPARVQTGIKIEMSEAENGKVRSTEVGSSSMASGGKPRKILKPKSVMGSQDTLLGSSFSLASKSNCLRARNITNSRCGLKNPRCNSKSDIVCSGFSPSESNIGIRKDVVKKRNPEVDSSSGRGKKMTGSLSKVGRSLTSSSGTSISHSRQSRNLSSSRDNRVLGSVRTQRPVNGNIRAILCNKDNGNCSAPTEIPIVTSHVPQPELSIGLDVPSSSNQVSVEASTSHSVSSSIGNGGDSLPGIMRIDPAEISITNSLTNCDGLQRHAMDGIAEVLFALDRIEQDEELTYEQLLAFETNLFLGGLGFYDQFREMRLGIDNMSYEELLALEEKMGTVSTALSEETISKCLERRIYYPATARDEDLGCGSEDVKCSICQEEYVSGDEVGRLDCKHDYHVVCIHQWLKLKNWCPVCKASVMPLQCSQPHD